MASAAAPAQLAEDPALALEITVIDSGGNEQRIAVHGRWRAQRPWLVSDLTEPGAATRGRLPVTGSVSARLGTVLGFQAPFVSAFELDLVTGENRLLVEADGLSPLDWIPGLRVPGRLVSGSDGTPVDAVTVSISLQQVVEGLFGVLEAARRAGPDILDI
ncbi:MAG: hypothetical protein ACRDRH_21005 [Pseudonocardia sp.]